MENFSTILQTVWRPAQKNSWVGCINPPDWARVVSSVTILHCSRLMANNGLAQSDADHEKRWEAHASPLGRPDRQCGA